MKREALFVIGALLVSSPVVGQSWETPSFFSPRAHDDIGLYLIDPDGGDLGFMAIWRQSGRINLGVRGGMGGVKGDRTVLVGAEFYGPLVRPNAGNVLAVSWIVGAGAAFDGFTWLRVPVGVSIGAEIAGSGITIVPYAHPRVSLDVIAIDVGGDEETDSEVNLDVDFGADLMLGARWIARFGLTVGEVDGFGLGIAYRIPRGVSVR